MFDFPDLVMESSGSRLQRVLASKGHDCLCLACTREMIVLRDGLKAGNRTGLSSSSPSRAISSHHGCKVNLPRNLVASSSGQFPASPLEILAHGILAPTLPRQVLELTRTGLRSPPLVLQDLLCRQPLSRVQQHHFHEQVDADGTDDTEGCLPFLARFDWFDVFFCGSDVALEFTHAGPILFGRCTDLVTDHANHVDVCVWDGGEKDSSAYQLSKDAADGPDVYSCRVVSGLVVQLWGPVPLCYCVVCHVSIRVGKGTRETKIGQFNGAVGGNEQVVRLYISMQDKVLMTEPDCAAEHDHPCFHVRGTVMDGFDVLNQFQQVTLGEMLQD